MSDTNKTPASKRELQELVAKWRKPVASSTYANEAVYNACADELERLLSCEEQPPQFEPPLEDLTHTRSCPSLTPLHEEDCTCGLKWKIRLRTEMEMHNAWRKETFSQFLRNKENFNAWRKRAEKAERALQPAALTAEQMCDGITAQLESENWILSSLDRLLIKAIVTKYAALATRTEVKDGDS